MRSQLVLAALSALVLCGCLDNELPPDAALGDDDAFIAVPRDFCGFRDWMAFELRDVTMHAGVSGKVVVYLKQLPPTGATSFPVGSMVVKTVEAGEQSGWEVHAMVKRGAGFNARGALGWEYFDLGLDDDCTPTVHWRGDHAPRDHGYKSLPGLEQETGATVDCNSCHGAAGARENDAILSKPLRLGDLS